MEINITNEEMIAIFNEYCALVKKLEELEREYSEKVAESGRLDEEFNRAEADLKIANEKVDNKKEEIYNCKKRFMDKKFNKYVIRVFLLGCSLPVFAMVSPTVRMGAITHTPLFISAMLLCGITTFGVSALFEPNLRKLDRYAILFYKTDEYKKAMAELESLKRTYEEKLHIYQEKVEEISEHNKNCDIIRTDINNTKLQIMNLKEGLFNKTFEISETYREQTDNLQHGEDGPRLVKKINY